jgi:perosamine synthetase
MKKIPIYQPGLHGNEKKYVLDCLDSNWISSKGKYVRQFEESIENYVGGVYATSCSNGTVALHLALLALDIGPGDEVIVPAFTYIASVNAIRYVGAEPVFVDSDPATWNVTVGLIEDAITAKTKAIMCVHIYGVPGDVDPIIRLAREKNLKVIEDCAEALGSVYKGRHVGVSSDIATFSFFGNKTITTGEGGMVFSRHEELIRKVAHLKNQAVSNTIDYWHDCVGYNYRLTNIASAIGLAQLERVDEILGAKRRLADSYRRHLEPLGVRFQEVSNDCVSSCWLNVVQLPSHSRVNSAKDRLTQAGVEVRPAFPLVSEMPPYKNINSKEFPHAKNISQTAICLPSFPDLSSEDVDYICRSISDGITSD